ncbi:MAG: hypothetical protein JWM16_2791 [Verrucomicrobiales bacterium]|nr:hypothetical protein [Verrucomicrobiales bacterium]
MSDIKSNLQKGAEPAVATTSGFPATWLARSATPSWKPRLLRRHHHVIPFPLPQKEVLAE